MPPRKKEVQPELGATRPAKPEAPVAPPAPSLPPVAALVEYNCGPDTWLCKRFAALVAELPGLTVDVLGRLQDALRQSERQWLVARRLFGLLPSVPASNYPVEDLRVWSQEELAVFLGITGPQMQQELQAIRGIWASVRPDREPVATPAEPPVARGLFSDDALLAQYDLKRIRFKDHDEMERFLKRVRDVQKLLEEKMTAGIARNLLMTELQLWRLDETLTLSDLQGEDWRKNMKMRGDLDATYNDQLARIDKLAPWAGAIAGKYSFKGTLSEVSAAYQEYYATGETKLIDGIFTHTEVQVLFRRSVQAPEPQYRAGWLVAALNAKANLWRADYREVTPPRVLKLLDLGFKHAIKAAGQETGEALVDLEKEGPAGEYQKLETLPAAGAN